MDLMFYNCVKFWWENIGKNSKKLWKNYDFNLHKVNLPGVHTDPKMLVLDCLEHILSISLLIINFDISYSCLLELFIIVITRIVYNYFQNVVKFWTQLFFFEVDNFCWPLVESFWNSSVTKNITCNFLVYKTNSSLYKVDKLL